MEIADDAEDLTAQQEWNLLIHELSGSESDELNVEEHPDQTDNGLSVEECSAMHPFRPTIPQIRIFGFVGRKGCIALQ